MRLDDMPVFRGMPHQKGFGDGQVFIGLPYQRGSSFGSFFGGLFRRILPILGTVAKTFITSTAEGLNRGDTLGSSAKSALMPTLKEGISGAVREFRKRPAPPQDQAEQEADKSGEAQKGSGRKRRRVRHSGREHTKRRKRNRRSKSSIQHGQVVKSMEKSVLYNVSLHLLTFLFFF
jgi:hypothetical protein